MKLRKIVLGIGGILLIVATVGMISPPTTELGMNGLNYHPRQLLVKFNGIDGVSLVQKKYNLQVVKVFDKIGVYVLSTAKPMNIPRLINYINKEKGVVYAEPDYLRQAFHPPNDQYYSQQWGLAKVNVAEYWHVEYGKSNIVVAIIDSGIDLDHEDLVNKLWKNIDEIAGNNIDDDGNGYVDDIYGYDFAGDGPFPLPWAEDSNPDDEHGHGTWVAGRVAAQTNNNIGVAGMAPGVKLMAVKVLSKLGSGYSSDIIDGVFYAEDNGAQVANMSLGGKSYSQSEYAAYNYVYRQNLCMVCASGNEGNSGNPISYPAGYAQNLAIGATDNTDNVAYFSTYGAQVDLSAPGVNDFSTIIGGYEGGWSGTSMATPNVAGAAALLYSQYPDIKNWQARMMLRQGVVDIETVGWDKYSGFGRLDMLVLLRVATPISTVEHLIMPIEGSHLQTSKDVFSLLWSPVDGAVRYEVIITLPNGKTKTISTTQTIYTVNPDTYVTAPNGQYQWQVKAIDAGGTVISTANSYFFKG